MKKELEPWQQLLINCCKSKKVTMRKLRKICCMGYLHPFTNTTKDDDLVFRCLHNLWEMNKRSNEDLLYLLDQTTPENIWKYGRPDGMNTTLVDTWLKKDREVPDDIYNSFICYFISESSLTTVVSWDNYKSPAKFRNQNKS